MDLIEILEKYESVYEDSWIALDGWTVFRGRKKSIADNYYTHYIGNSGAMGIPFSSEEEFLKIIEWKTKTLRLPAIKAELLKRILEKV
jgi:hypothetical protein